MIFSYIYIIITLVKIFLNLIKKYFTELPLLKKYSTKVTWKLATAVQINREDKKCNCWFNKDCPLDGYWLEKDVAHRATIKYKDKIEYYIGAAKCE